MTVLRGHSRARKRVDKPSAPSLGCPRQAQRRLSLPGIKLCWAGAASPGSMGCKSSWGFLLTWVSSTRQIATSIYFLLLARRAGLLQDRD